jgi:hypothetical protein
MNSLTFPLDRINEFLKNHSFEIENPFGDGLNTKISLTVKVKLTGIKPMISIGEWRDFIEYTIFLEDIDSTFSKELLKMRFRGSNDYNISNTDTTFYLITSKVNEVLHNFLKYWSVDNLVTCTRIVDNIKVSDSKNINENLIVEDNPAMEKILKIVKKHLLSQPFYEDGFEYQFISAEVDDDISIDFTVNVILPKKGQSFVVEKFSYDVANIIENVSKYMGEKIVYMEHILVDGKPTPKSGIYINPEDSKEIIRSLNENVNKVTLSNHNDVSYVESKISFRPQKNREFYSLDDATYIDIYLDYNLSNLIYNDESVNLNIRKIDEFAETFNEKLQNSDRFRDKLQDVIYRVLNPSIKIEDIEVYVNANFWIDKVDGMETHDSGGSLRKDFTPEMFTPAS